MKRIIIFIFIIFLSFNNVYALEECTPSEEYLKYLELDEEERKNIQEPIYCKELLDKKDNNIKDIKSTLRMILTSSKNDIRYNAMDEGIITSIKNQYTLGTCWSFAAASSVESNALKNGLETYDFSEAHMIYSLIGGAYSDSAGKAGKYITENLNGGKVNYAASYFLNGYGQLFEEEYPYPRYQKIITSSEYIKGRNIISVETIEFNNLNNYTPCTNEEIQIVKEQLINNGSIQGSMYMDETLFKDTNKDYYISTTQNGEYPNHAISIIGWDDTISKNNFTNATRDGAFIIKNSWGENWSRDGLFYISYDDNFVCKNIVSYSGVSNETYDYYYKSADLVGFPAFTFKNKLYISAKISKMGTKQEDLKRVTFPTGINTAYNIYLSLDNNLNNQSNWIKIASGVSSTIGFKSINLDNISINGDFTIIAEYLVTNDDYSMFITTCNHEEDTSNLEISANTNFYSENGTTWKDLNNITLKNGSISCEPNFYAYTRVQPTLEVNSILTENNITTINLLLEDITNTDNISYTILDGENNNRTNNFTIEKNYNNGTIKIYPNNIIPGIYKIKINYGTINIENNFEIKQTFTIKDNTTMNISKDILTIIVKKNETITKAKLGNNIDANDLTFELLDKNEHAVSDETIIGTNMKLLINSIKYNITIVGDVTEDGLVNSADLLRIVKYLKGTATLDNIQTNAADATRDNKINSADLLRIVKYLKGTVEFTF